jgi:hypothetical protein
MKSKFDNVKLGLLLGIFVPIIAILVFYFTSKYSVVPLPDFIKFMLKRQIFSSLLSLCVIPDLLVFFIFIWLDWMNSAKGVLISTFIYAFLVLAIKIISHSAF